MKQKTYIEKRKWLNPVGHWNTGAIAYSVIYDYGISANLSLWDCGRKVTLDLSVSDEKSAKQVAKKIDTLIESLQEMKQALGEAYQDNLDGVTNDEYDDE